MVERQRRREDNERRAAKEREKRKEKERIKRLKQKPMSPESEETLSTVIMDHHFQSRMPAVDELSADTKRPESGKHLKYSITPQTLKSQRKRREHNETLSKSMSPNPLSADTK